MYEGIGVTADLCKLDDPSSCQLSICYLQFFWVRAEELTRVCGVLRWKREEYLRWTVTLWCTGVCDSSWKLAARDSGLQPFMHQRVMTRMVLPRDIQLGHVQDKVWHRATVTWALQATLDPELVGCWEYARIQRTIQDEAWNKVNLTYLEPATRFRFGLQYLLCALSESDDLYIETWHRASDVICKPCLTGWPWTSGHGLSCRMQCTIQGTSHAEPLIVPSSRVNLNTPQVTLNPEPPWYASADMYTYMWYHCFVRAQGWKVDIGAYHFKWTLMC